MTDWKDRYEVAPWMIKIDPDKTNMLRKTSAADCFQVRSISTERLVRKTGRIDDETLDKIKDGLARVFSIIH